jgi:GNAT superfamily N-acetyltransferase
MDADLELAELAAMRAQWSGLPGGTAVQVGGLHVFAAPGPAWLRQVCGLGLTGGTEALDGALGRVPGALVSVVDGVLPVAELERRGYRPELQLLRLAAAPAAPAARESWDWRVEVVGREAAALVSAVAGAGFGLELPHWWAAPLGAPGWTQVVAYDGAVPVATGGLHVASGGGWVGAATTVPAVRGRGAHAALLAARLRLAAEQGAQRVSVKVQPGSASHRNLLRAGFAEVYGLTQWTRDGTAGCAN